MAKDPELPFGPGDVVGGKYAVERVLGAGGMGVVYAVRHLGLGEPRALKLMLPQVVVDAGARERFLREARAAARLESPHVPRVYDVGVFEGELPYIELELLEGEDLKERLQREGPQPPELVLDWVRQACVALSAAHAAGIVHRDLKPANLFLSKRDGVVKVLDFGIAKVQDRLDGGLTSTKTIIGSPLYMSPEHMRRSSQADARSDVWSLGVVLFELLTAQTPFHADTYSGLVLAVNQDPAPAPSDVRPGLAPPLDRLVLRCLEKQPDARFASAKELKEAIEAVLAGGDVAGAGATTAAPRPDTPLSSTTQATTASTQAAPQRTVARVAGASVVATIVVSLGVWGLSRPAGSAPPPSTPAAGSGPAISITQAPSASPSPVLVTPAPSAEPSASATGAPAASAAPTARPGSKAAGPAPKGPATAAPRETAPPKPTTGFSGVD